MSYVDYIIAWHGDHDENSQYPDCPVYKAIQDGVPDEQLIAIAEEVDGDLRKAYFQYYNTLKGRIRMAKQKGNASKKHTAKGHPVHEVVSHGEPIYNFALRIAAAMDDLKSSHIFFVIQKAFGEIEWEEAEEILRGILTHCHCGNCEAVKSQVRDRFSGG